MVLFFFFCSWFVHLDIVLAERDCFVGEFGGSDRCQEQARHSSKPSLFEVGCFVFLVFCFYEKSPKTKKKKKKDL